MGIVGDITNLLAQGYKAWKEIKGDNTISKQELYDKYIQPCYLLLKEIHSDYLEFYCELEERIELANNVTPEIAKWFSKVRLNKQADRSELILIKFPKMKGKSEKTKNINDLVVMFFSKVQSYFLPEDVEWSELKGRRASHLTSRTRSSMTEYKLNLLVRWLELSEYDRLVLIAEEKIEDKFKTIKDPTIYPDILNELLSVFSESESNENRELKKISQSRTDNVKDALSKIMTKSELEEYEKESFSYQWEEVFGWGAIIEEHVRRERWRMEYSIKEVQKIYFKLRVLLDRS